MRYQSLLDNAAGQYTHANYCRGHTLCIKRCIQRQIHRRSLCLRQRSHWYWTYNCGLERAHTMATSHHRLRLSRRKSSMFYFVIDLPPGTGDAQYNRSLFPSWQFTCASDISQETSIWQSDRNLSVPKHETSCEDVPYLSNSRRGMWQTLGGLMIVHPRTLSSVASTRTHGLFPRQNLEGLCSSVLHHIRVHRCVLMRGTTDMTCSMNHL